MSSDKKASDAVIERRVRIACYFALLALALMVLSLVHPAPLAVVAAMSVGQGIGTLSLLFFIFAIVADLRRSYVRVREQDAAPSSKAPKAEESADDKAA